MSGIVKKNAGRASGIVGVGDIGADAVDSANIADDAIDSEHYADGSIDNAHIADDAIDSEHYADGSIDNAHIADDAIDSEHYATGSIDTAHIATNQIDETLMKDAFVGDFTDATVTASDYFLHGDTTDSGNTKKDTVQGVIDLVTDTDQSWSGSQRGTPSTVTDGTLDLDTANNFKYTPAASPDTLEFSNEEAGQSGFITLINPSGHTIALGSEVKKGASWDVSTAGTYLISYYCDGTNVYVSASEALS